MSVIRIRIRFYIFQIHYVNIALTFNLFDKMIYFAVFYEKKKDFFSEVLNVLDFILIPFGKFVCFKFWLFDILKKPIKTFQYSQS